MGRILIYQKEANNFINKYWWLIGLILCAIVFYIIVTL